MCQRDSVLHRSTRDIVLDLRGVRACLRSCLWVLPTLVALWPMASLADPPAFHLSHLAGLDAQVVPYHINDRGQVVGVRDFFSSGDDIGFIARGPRVEWLPVGWEPYASDTSSRAAGTYTSLSGDVEGFLRTDEQTIMLGGGTYGSFAFGISPDGVIVGNAQTDLGPIAGFTEGDGQWTLRFSRTPDRTNAYIYDRNRAGAMVGFSPDSPIGTNSAPVLWPPGAVDYEVLLNSSPYNHCGAALAINDSGMAAGWFKAVDDPLKEDAEEWRPCVWIDGDCKTLGNWPGCAYDINNKGWVVGTAFIGHWEAMLWIPDSAGTYQSHALKTLIDSNYVLFPDTSVAPGPHPGYPSSMLGATLASANSINDCGVIVGNSTMGPFVMSAIDSTDSDGDGLWDTWERCGVDANLDGWTDCVLDSVSPYHKDLLVEVDYMPLDAGPMTTALGRVRGVFGNVPNSILPFPPNPDGQPGVTLHARVSDRVPQMEFTYASIWSEFDLIKDFFFGHDVPAGEEWNAEQYRKAKLLAYRYCVWGTTMDEGYTGLSELKGDDLIVTVGGCEWANICDAEILPVPIPQAPVEMQAGVFMHELGHAMGLDHGGADDVNFKPNYFSVMNYHWTFPLADSAGPESQGWRLDYSREMLPTLDEAALVESAGLGGSVDLADVSVVVVTNATTANGDPILMLAPLEGTGWIDYDADGGETPGTVASNVNNVPPLGNIPGYSSPPDERLVSHLDWRNILLRFRNEGSWLNATGPGRTLDCHYTPELFQVLKAHRAQASATVDVGSGAPTFAVRILGPNPGSGAIPIALTLPVAGWCRLELFDVQGRTVASSTEFLEAGEHLKRWDVGEGEAGRRGPGLYFLRVGHEGRSVTTKVVTLR